MKHLPAASVQVFRGDAVESSHLVDITVADADGAIHTVYGEPECRVFPRSSIKSLQALLLVESGASDAFGFDDRHLALACSSHNAEPMHVESAREMLALAGVSETCLECGAQLPERQVDQANLIKSGTEISSIHNNCSGKHAGFLAASKHLGLEFQGYVGVDHPLQKEIAGILEAVTHEKHGVKNHGIDGCSIPTYRIPLASLATVYARFGVGQEAGKERSKAMIRLRDACLDHPEMVAGTGRVCTRLMKALGKRTFVKVGAEGVYTASLPELGLGIAMKARDGNARAVEVVVSTLISRLLSLNEEEMLALEPLVKPVLRNRNQIDVGSIVMAD